MLGHRLGVAPRSVDHQHAVPGGGVHVDVARSSAAYAHQPETRRRLEDFLKDEVHLYDEYVATLFMEPCAQLLRVPELAGLHPALVAHVDAAPQPGKLRFAERRKYKSAMAA